MSKDKFATTPAIRMLRERGAAFTLHPYTHQERGGTGAASQALHVDEHRVVKTLVMEDESGEPLVVLMHGDRKASTKELARFLGVKSVRPCDPKTAHRHTGYLVGGISPFGTRRRLRVYVEASILDLESCYINAGRKGLLAELSPAEFVRILEAVVVDIAIRGKGVRA